jgi:uncharacterized protein involved in tolerance to divalent cations
LTSLLNVKPNNLRTRRVKSFHNYRRPSMLVTNGHVMPKMLVNRRVKSLHNYRRPSVLVTNARVMPKMLVNLCTFHFTAHTLPHCLDNRLTEGG